MHNPDVTLEECDEKAFLRNEDDFEWHVKLMRAKARIHLDVQDKPKEYPCLIASKNKPHGNAQNYIDSTYYYLNKNKCSRCGQQSSNWDNSIADIAEELFSLL